MTLKLNEEDKQVDMQFVDVIKWIRKDNTSYPLKAQVYVVTGAEGDGREANKKIMCMVKAVKKRRKVFKSRKKSIKLTL